MKNSSAYDPDLLDGLDWLLQGGQLEDFFAKNHADHKSSTSCKEDHLLQ